jgi:hypothetical protein
VYRKRRRLKDKEEGEGKDSEETVVTEDDENNNDASNGEMPSEVDWGVGGGCNKLSNVVNADKRTVFIG